MRVSTGSAAPRVPTLHHIATVTKEFAQYRVYHPFTSRTASTRAVIDFQSASKCFFDVAMVLEAWPGGPGAADPVLARILTAPEPIVKLFCNLHRRSYRVAIPRYFFRILFSSPCCAVIGFVAGIVHRALFDTFCFWACNSPYFILIFLLPPQIQALQHLDTLRYYSLLHRSCCWVRAIFVMRTVVAVPAEKCFTKTLDK